METLVLVARIGLALVFATAGAGKLADLAGSRRAMTEFGLPEWAARPAGTALPIAEIAVAGALLIGPAARWGSIAATVLLAAFVVGIGRALALGQAPDCHCFGSIHSAPASRLTLMRNVLLAAVGVFIAIEAPGRSLADLGVGSGVSSTVAVAGVVASAVLAVVCLELWREKRSLGVALRKARASVGKLPPGLPIGYQAPNFSLPTTAGETMTLRDLCERDRMVLLGFMDPGCGPCGSLFADLLQWEPALSERLSIAIVSRGTAEEQRELADEAADSGSLRVFLQEGTEVAEQFRLRSTPSAMIIGPDGRVASGVAEGPRAIEALIRLTLQREAATGQPQAMEPAVAGSGSLG